MRRHFGAAPEGVVLYPDYVKPEFDFIDGQWGMPHRRASCSGNNPDDRWNRIRTRHKREGRTPHLQGDKELLKAAR